MVMWNNLPKSQKQYYQKLILSFASLSEAFSQKAESEGDTENNTQSKVAPIVNSKFQETVFQRSFGAYGEDIGNTSYDASVIVDEHHKYLVGLKSFGIGSGDQKIAQFKRPQTELGWRRKFNEITENARGLESKTEIDKINEDLYRYLAIEISKLRNQRIASSKENLRGFTINDETYIEAVYHFLMPSKKENPLQIFVGEVPYYDIDIDNIVIEGCTSAKKPMNFKFHDGRHHYKYTEADSQLLMTFDKTPLDIWDVHYVEDPFSIFAEIGNASKEIEQIQAENQLQIVDSISWKINLQPVSGFNQFMGLPKNSTGSIQSFINTINKDFSDETGISELVEALTSFKETYHSKSSFEKYSTRKDIMNLCISFVNFENVINNDGISLRIPSYPLVDLAIKYLFRSPNEIYIPIPNSKTFHNTHPNFFGTGFGILNGSTFELPLSERQFKLEFLPSHTIVDAQITQENGKAIQSSGNQDILGNWILQKIFQLPEFTPLTDERLIEMELNGIRLTKFSDLDNHIGLEFIWIDDDNLPSDYWN